MTTRQATVAGLLLTAAALLYSLALYSVLPERIPTHWNWHGQVDDWGSKQWATFLMPGVIALFVMLLYALPWLSPRNFAVDSFRATFNYLMVLTMALMGYLHVIMLQAALHSTFNLARTLVAGIFIFIALIGKELSKVHRNFWMGVRTPWTLASEEVWTATHRLAARLLLAAGLIGALAVLLGVPLVACFVFLMVALLIPVPYSLFLYKRLEREERI